MKRKLERALGLERKRIQLIEDFKQGKELRKGKQTMVGEKDKILYKKQKDLVSSSTLNTGNFQLTLEVLKC